MDNDRLALSNGHPQPCLAGMPHVVEPDKLMETAWAAAERIASHPPLGVRVEMESYQRSFDMSRSDSMAMAGHMYRLARSVQSTQPPLAEKGAAE